MKLTRYLLVGAAALAATVAIAQTIPVPSALPVGPADLIQVIKGGVPSAQSTYAPLGILGATQGYQNLGVITTGNTFAVNANVGNVFAQPAGTLAAVTLTAPASPSDGQHVCFTSTQTTTALTFTANTGQTVSSSPAGVANVPTCWTFVKSNATWYIGG